MPLLMMAAERMAQMFKDGLRVVPPVLIAPCEIVVRVDGNLNPIVVKIEYDEEGLHFLNEWGMVTLSNNVIEVNLDESQSEVHVPELHN